MIISNSSPLIYLAKLHQLSLLKTLFKKVFIPEEVYEEVVLRGKQEKFFDALTVEQAYQEGWLNVEKIVAGKEYLALASEIDMGEVAAILLAKQRRAELVLLDDASARTIAQGLGLTVKGTIFVLLRAYKKKLFSKEEVKKLLARLVTEGFRISQELYVEVLNEIDAC